MKYSLRSLLFVMLVCVVLAAIYGCYARRPQPVKTWVVIYAMDKPMYLQIEQEHKGAKQFSITKVEFYLPGPTLSARESEAFVDDLMFSNRDGKLDDFEKLVLSSVAQRALQGTVKSGQR